MKRAILLLLGLVISDSPLGSQVSPGKPTQEGLVEFRLANGSVVIMMPLQDQIEVVTDFGKLTVPLGAVSQIEFGLRTSEAEAKQIEGAILRLNDNEYRDREAAVRTLVDLGPPAYLRLHHTPKTEGAEVTKRIETALVKIREKHPARLLRLRDEDVIRTNKFTIVGRIANVAIKARAEEFGELELHPSKLLSMRWLGRETSKAVAVDAAKFGGQAREWMDTGIRVGPLQGLKITATGQVDQWPQQPGQYMVGPDGNGVQPGLPGAIAVRAVGRATGAESGALLGRIGENGASFVIGSNYAQTPKAEGKLYLQIGPSPWNCPSTGSYSVAITTGAVGGDGD